MDDLSDKLDKLLSSPDSMKRIEEMMAAMGVAAHDPTPAPTPTEDDFDMSVLFKVLPAIESLSKQDDNTALLSALRPHLQPERRKKLDEAANMMKLLKLLPRIQDLAGKEES